MAIGSFDFFEPPRIRIKVRTDEVSRAIDALVETAKELSVCLFHGQAPVLTLRRLGPRFLRRKGCKTNRVRGTFSHKTLDPDSVGPV